MVKVDCLMKTLQSLCVSIVQTPRPRSILYGEDKLFLSWWYFASGNNSMNGMSSRKSRCKFIFIYLKRTMVLLNKSVNFDQILNTEKLSAKRMFKICKCARINQTR